ncbi:MAG: AbrB/MazE/SpoVT family DNA-binding domain-containing protein [Oscillospiraceae bacterium]|nr:AbrB/MazE/SpoVT family DNA-binding domain-containing protein [Oscillospiraceae bacterium]
MEMAKVTSKGQITIPVSIRRRLSINEGDKLLFIDRPEGVIMVNPDMLPGAEHDSVELPLQSVQELRRAHERSAPPPSPPAEAVEVYRILDEDTSSTDNSAGSAVILAEPSFLAISQDEEMPSSMPTEYLPTPEPEAELELEAEPELETNLEIETGLRAKLEAEPQAVLEAEPEDDFEPNEGFVAANQAADFAEDGQSPINEALPAEPHAFDDELPINEPAQPPIFEASPHSDGAQKNEPGKPGSPAHGLDLHSLLSEIRTIGSNSL